MSSKSRRRIPLPKEHALWAWIGLPQLVAMIVVPSAGTVLVGLGLVAGTMLGLGQLERRGFRPGRSAWLEVPGLLAFGLAGLGSAVLFGAELAPTAARMAAITAWQTIGLFHVRSLLASVLKNRDGWPEGLWISGGLTVAGLGLAAWLGKPAVGGVPLFYGARMVLDWPPASAKEVKRIGLTEGAWGAAAAVVIALL